MKFLTAWSARAAACLHLPHRLLVRALWFAACLATVAWILHAGLADIPDAIGFSMAKSTELYRARLIAVGELIAIAILAGLYLVLRRYRSVRRFR